ncbi:hypothetical protein DPEC_G00361520 [Dallia pectoralis]|nr:hypothetical protein DPEC_G00361520 [Dallia pectoralis]
MKYMTSCTRLVVVRRQHCNRGLRKPHVRILIESPSGEHRRNHWPRVLAVIYGSTLAAIYSTMDRAPGLVEECEEQPQKRLLDSGVDITQLSNDVIKRDTVELWVD